MPYQQAIDYVIITGIGTFYHLLAPLKSASKIAGYRAYRLLTKQRSPPVCIVLTNPDIVGSLDLLK